VKRNNLFLLLLTGIIYFPSSAQTSAEINAGSYRLGAEVALRHYPDPKKKWSVSTFNRALYYPSDKSTGFFNFSSIAYHFKSGIGLSVNLSGNDERFYTTIGARFEKSFRKFHLYFITTYAFLSNSLTEDYLILAYKHPFNHKINLVTQIEFYTRLEKQDEDHFYERIKAGIQFHKTQVGLFNESFQSSGKNTHPANFGCYIKQYF
jgi:hypothetical protein